MIGTTVVLPVKLEVRLHEEEAVPENVEKFSPDEPRDDHGMWTAGGSPGHGYSADARLVGGKIYTSNVNDAVRALYENKQVVLNQPREVSTLLDKLGAVSQRMIAEGDKAPVFNLCNVSVSGTNLFCADNKGIPRIKMPQVTDPAGFRAYLASMGASEVDGNERASYLRATQNELNGAKVAAIANHMDPKQFGRLFVSSDNYIVDGHHRWAAMIGLDARDGKIGDLMVPVTRVNMKIVDLLKAADKFSPQREGFFGKFDASQPRGEDGRWSGEGYHGTYESNLKSILKDGIKTHEHHVFIASDPETAAMFSGSKYGDAKRVVFKVQVPEKFRDRFQNYSFEPNTIGAREASIKVSPEWIKSWAEVKKNSLDLGAWNDVKKDDAGNGIFYLCVAFPDDTEKFDPAEARDDHGEWTSGGGVTLNSAEGHALVAYQAGGNGIMNAQASGKPLKGEYVPSHLSGANAVPKATAALKSAISRASLSSSATLYRGMAGDQLASDGMVGKIITYDRFLSTSSSKQVAVDRGGIAWMETNPDRKDESAQAYTDRAAANTWLLTIRAPAGTQAMNVEKSLAMSGKETLFKEEKEFIMGPGTKLRIDGFNEARRQVMATVVR